jgi:hypothetical protein
MGDFSHNDSSWSNLFWDPVEDGVDNEDVDKNDFPVDYSDYSNSNNSNNNNVFINNGTYSQFPYPVPGYQSLN